MENKSQDFTELRSLLEERAKMVPPCDLEVGFINDLHAKIHEEKTRGSLLEMVRDRFIAGFQSHSGFAWGGVGFALFLCAFTIAIFNGQKQHSELVEQEGLSNESFTQVEVSVDFNGALPAFTSAITEF